MGFAFPITIFLFAFAGGIGTGASSVIARAYGAGDRAQAARLVTHAELLVLIIGVVAGAFGMVFAEDVVALLGAQGEVRSMATEYLSVYMLGFPLFMLSMVGSTLLRATGSAASPGVVMTTGSVIQIGLGPLLIFGWLGFPELGIAGAAWAYVASRVFSVALYIVILVRVRMVSWSLDDLWKSWWAILHVGGPATASGLIMPVSMLAHQPDCSPATATKSSRATPSPPALRRWCTWSCGPRRHRSRRSWARNWGARNYARVRRAMRLANWFCLAWGVVTFVVLAIAGDAVVRLIDPNETVREVAAMFFLIIPLSIGFMGVMQVATSCFNALGQPLPPLTISIARSIAFYVPLAILGDYLWGYVGIFLATALSNVLLGVLAWYWNRVVGQARDRGSGFVGHGNATTARRRQVRIAAPRGMSPVMASTIGSARTARFAPNSTRPNAANIHGASAS